MLRIPYYSSNHDKCVPFFANNSQPKYFSRCRLVCQVKDYFQILYKMKIAFDADSTRNFIKGCHEKWGTIIEVKYVRHRALRYRVTVGELHAGFWSRNFAALLYIFLSVHCICVLIGFAQLSKAWTTAVTVEAVNDAMSARDSISVLPKGWENAAESGNRMETVRCWELQGTLMGRTSREIITQIFLTKFVQSWCLRTTGFKEQPYHVSAI
jgi:hypothetical protein